MTTVTVQAEIDSKGVLRLDVPVGLPAGHAEVVLVVHSDAGKSQDDMTPTRPRAARSGLFSNKSAEIDLDATLIELNEAWRAKLSGLS